MAGTLWSGGGAAGEEEEEEDEEEDKVAGPETLTVTEKVISEGRTYA